MLLYHFTARQNLEAILGEGITRGDVPTSPNGGFNAPWLTRNPNDAAQSWQGGGKALDAKSRQYLFAMGLIPHPETAVRTIDKTEVGLRVKIPADDRKLIHWPTFARKRLSPQWYAALDEAGGGGSADWFIYRGRIPPEWIIQTMVRGHVAQEASMPGPVESGSQTGGGRLR